MRGSLFLFTFTFYLFPYASGVVFFARGALFVVVLRVVVPPSFFVRLVVIGVMTDSTISETAEAASVTTSPTPETMLEPTSRTGVALSAPPAAAAAARCRG